MSAKSAIRTERAKIREQLAKLRVKVGDLENQEDALTGALRALGDTRARRNGKAPARKPAGTGRGPDRRPKISQEELADKISHILDDQPQRAFKPAELAKLLDRAQSSCYRACRRLVDEKRAATAPRQHAHGAERFTSAKGRTTVRPGEGVR